MAATPNANDSDANPGRTGPTGRTDEITRLGNTPGGGSSGAAEGGGRGGATGGAGGYLSGGPDVDEALAAGEETAREDHPPDSHTEPVDRTRVIGGSVAHPYGVDPTEGGSP